jgi:hypothetical protein
LNDAPLVAGMVLVEGAGEGEETMFLKNDSSGGKPFTPAPAGMHNAVLCDVVDMGIVPNPHEPGKTQHKLRLTWQIDEVNPSYDRRHEASAFYTASLNEKANLRKMLKTWLGKTDKELDAGIDLEALIGTPAQIQITHRISSAGKTFANVVAVVPLMKGMAPLSVTPDFVRAKDRKPKDGAATEAEQEPPF